MLREGLSPEEKHKFLNTPIFIRHKGEITNQDEDVQRRITFRPVRKEHIFGR